MKRQQDRGTAPPGGYSRHHHRVSTTKTTWDDWIGGQGGSAGKKLPWLKISALAAAGLILLGIIAGLVIELWVF